MPPSPLPRVFRLFLVLALLAALLPLSASGATGAGGGSAPFLGEPPRAPAPPLGAPLAASSTLAAGCSEPNCIYLPLVTRYALDPRDRQQALDLYNRDYLGSEGIAPGWTGGNISTCKPGTTSLAFRDSVLMRINYFRQMAGVPKVVELSDTFNQQDQAAALMMAANKQLNHNPPSSWTCYTDEGKRGAQTSNLAMGLYGPAAISLYMDDSKTYSLGHRRWVLYPQTQEMGTGDIPGASGWQSQVNAMKAWDDNIWDARPATRDEFVAWPPAAYVPYTVVYPVWSFSVAGANFSAATVTLTSGGETIPVTITTATDSGYGENTLGWEACDCSSWPDPGLDKVYQVKINNVKIGSTPHNYSYTVTVFSP